MRFVFLNILAIALLFGVPQTVAGQFGVQNPNTVTVSVTPTNPEPSDDVSVSLVSYSTDLNSAEISWFINGEALSSGTGNTEVAIEAGESGETQTLRAVIRTADGGIVEKSIPITPAGIDLLWQADTYTPPFYEGHSIFTHQSSVRVTAMPEIRRSDGSLYSPGDLVYEWERDNQVDMDASGYAQRSYEFESGNISNPIRLRVTASPRNSNITAEKRVTFIPTDTEVVIYRKHPIYGLQIQTALSSLGEYILNDDEIEIVAVPYFYNISSRDDESLRFGWSMNSRDFDVSDDSSSDVVLRREEGVEGSSNISVRVNNELDFMQRADADLRITFGDEQIGGGGDISNSIFY